MITQQQIKTPIPDYRKTYFPYPDLDRVHGQPTIDQIVIIYKRLKQNAAIMPTTLRGGKHRFRPLIITCQHWNENQNVKQFIRPEHSSLFQPPQTQRLTNAELAVATARQEQRLHNYHTCQQLKQRFKTNVPTSSIMMFQQTNSGTELQRQ